MLARTCNGCRSFLTAGVDPAQALHGVYCPSCRRALQLASPADLRAYLHLLNRHFWRELAGRRAGAPIPSDPNSALAPRCLRSAVGETRT